MLMLITYFYWLCLVLCSTKEHRQTVELIQYGLENRLRTRRAWGTIFILSNPVNL